MTKVTFEIEIEIVNIEFEFFGEKDDDNVTSFFTHDNDDLIEECARQFISTGDTKVEIDDDEYYAFVTFNAKDEFVLVSMS